MANLTSNMETQDSFPSPPIHGGKLLVPITSWTEMHRETEITGVEFNEHWYDSVYDGVAYFFCWLGEPRSTVLVVWGDEGPTWIECRKEGDLLVSEEDSERINAEVTQLFHNVGFGHDSVTH